MKLVIVGEFDSDNLGDKLIGEGHAVLFSGQASEVKILSLEPSGRLLPENLPAPEHISFVKALHRSLYQRSIMYRHSLESMAYIRRRDVYRRRAEEILMDADAVIIGGGQLLSDGTLRMLHRLDQITETARRRGLPVVVFGTGMSSGKSFFSRRILLRVLSRLSECNRFRDIASMEAARSVRPSINLSSEPTPDCAIAGIARRKKVDASADLVGIAPMSPMILSRLGIRVANIDEWWINIVRSLMQRGAKPVLFCTGVQADMQYAAMLHGKLVRAGLVVKLLPKPKASDDLLDMLSRMKRILAQRLHASISFYALGGVPASASWDRKVTEFYERIALQDRVFRVGMGEPGDIASKLIAPAEHGVRREVFVTRSLLDAARCVQELAHARSA